MLSVVNSSYNKFEVGLSVNVIYLMFWLQSKEVFRKGSAKMVGGEAGFSI